MKGLAGLRKSRNLTQSAVAERLGTDQAAVSRIERRGDVLVSTLREYLTAIGAESPRVVVDFGGEDFVLDLGLLP
ncbi:XRE family transcriptional regulator [Rhodococcus hoagii]|nr:XRE family transcriptional regulator [Prescottella equi]MBM4654195.1 XRE family transcriptional regulator [Prescottella equi]MBM4719669.1 XRE family transcriptional regulator [Prescottella equi]NKR23466.1 XRE family transcriptional regulator [Prescottella equi]NKT55922.1 XRE family transcriptional regulator [Prescottella equi]